MNTTKYAVFTMDVEAFSDTECVFNAGYTGDVQALDGLDEYMNILDKHGIKSTLFTVGKLAPKIADKIKVHIKNGHQLALHNYEHVAPMDMSVEQFRNQLKYAKESLSELFGTEIKGFRAPCFSMDKERLEVLRELGFRYDSSHLDFLRARHTVNLDLSDFKQLRDGIFCNNGFFEFGMSKQEVFGKSFPISGGGYVRLGYWEFIKSLINQYIKKHNYYVFYLHPFELTHEKIPFIKGLKSYDKYYLSTGIKTYAAKVEYIIKSLKDQGYKFVTFEELTDIMSKENA